MTAPSPSPTSAPPAPARPHIAILGAGVIGLSTALALLDCPVQCDVTVVSADFPAPPPGSSGNSQPTGSSPSPSPSPPASYASAWAGAHHVSCPANAREAQWDAECFAVLRALEAGGKGEGWPWPGGDAHGGAGSGTGGPAAPPPPPSRPLVWVKQLELFARAPSTEAEERAQAALRMYDSHGVVRLQGGGDTSPTDTLTKDSLRRSLPCFALDSAQTQARLPSHTAHTLNTLDINVPAYLRALYDRFLSLGGRAVRAEVKSLAQAVELASASSSPGRPHALFAAPGLGARHLAELQDGDVFPVRGQTVLVDAPWLRLRGRQPEHEPAHGEGHPSGGDDAGSASDPLWPALSRMNEQGERDLYIIPRGGGHFIVGGTRLPGDE